MTFIVEMIGVFVLLFLFQPVIGTCPGGTVSNSYSSKSGCLAFVYPGKLYLPADNFCRNEYHGDLTSIENGMANMFIARKIILFPHLSLMLRFQK